MTGCCVFRGVPISPYGLEAGALAKFAAHLVAKPDYATACSGAPPEQATNAPAADQAASAQLLPTRQEVLADTGNLLRQMDNLALCAALGTSLRAEEFIAPDKADKALVSRLVKAEARRRKIAVQAANTKGQTFALGASRCQVYASWGLPDSINRTVTRGHEHIQHVYGRAYVYTTNGIVTGFQD
jgi:hypothetical protein